MKVALGGGGDALQSKAIDLVFASWFPAGARLLYIPVALGKAPETVRAATEWLQSTFEQIADFEIEPRVDLADLAAGNLSGYDGVYIGGGDTYSLLHEFRSSGLLPVMRQAIENGLIAYGGSAGAALLGADISTVRHMDQNTVGIRDTRAIDIADRHAVWVHYTSTDDALISDYISETGYSVIAIPEESGVVVVDDSVRAVGVQQVTIWDGSSNPKPMKPHEARH